MRRRYRKSFRRKGRRLYRRRKTVARKALRVARSVSRKMAGEVRKIDVNEIIPENKFTQLSPAFGTAADNAQSLPDYGFVYYPINTNFGPGDAISEFTGNQIRAKMLYMGIHLQMPVRPDTSSPQTIQQPVCMRVMVVQDRNYQTPFTIQSLTQALFGVTGGTDTNGTNYLQKADYTMLPINPLQPGRFNVIRDFKMNVAPGYRMDYYKKIMILQKDLLSSGRFYAGGEASNASGPVRSTVSWQNMRNRIYVVLYYQSPTLYAASTGTSQGVPDFTVSIQTRLSYYDN